jgi:dihydrofolate synthase/folylpolyglutamate synthase
MKPQPVVRNQKNKDLVGGLAYLDRIPANIVSMGLGAVNTVKQALQLDPWFPIITVGGTNGKGSTCALLEAILSAAGYRVGCYTSPHFLRCNERVRINREPVKDDELGRVFSRVEEARGAIPLTYFEFGTLAAVALFTEALVDVAILEVGLGGRLDAVNAFDGACAVITSVAMDHMEYLGDTRETIGLEKAGIFRMGHTAVCAEPDVPESMRRYANDIGADFIYITKDFGFVSKKNHCHYWGPHGERLTLPCPRLRGAHQLQNASAAITALHVLEDRLPVTVNHIRKGLLEANIPGRFQILSGRPTVILDVAHNPHAAMRLADNLATMECKGRTMAVFAMLIDKDIAGVIHAITHRIDQWLVADIRESRGANAEDLVRELEQAGISGPVRGFSDPGLAYMHACQVANEEDRILVFGSFRTVAAVLRRCKESEPIAALP